MFPVIQIGPLSLQAPGLILILGLWLGALLAEKLLPRSPSSGAPDADRLYNLTFLTLLAGAAGARLAYVARYPQAFAASPLSLLSLNPGLLDLSGGAAAGLIAALIYGQRQGLRLWPTLDALTPLLAVLAVAVNFANLSSGAGFGTPTHLPWAVSLWGAARHPSQVYEILAAGLILGVVIRRASRSSAEAGLNFLGFLALSAGARLFLEAFRGDSILLPGGLRQAQVIAWGVLAISLWMLLSRRPAAHASPEQQP